MEPRVIDSLLASPYGNLYNRENIFSPRDGGGAGNIWASGYTSAQAKSEELIELLTREAESAESLAGFSLFHSIAGGTGSGLGSYLLEELKDSFPKQILTTSSVFPNSQEVSDVVVQPYNSLLSLKRLALHADMTTILDNSALHRLASDRQQQDSTFLHTNQLVIYLICFIFLIYD